MGCTPDAARAYEVDVWICPLDDRPGGERWLLLVTDPFGNPPLPVTA